MYLSELTTKEINTYYARYGGRRTASVKNFANYIENAKMNPVSPAGSRTASVRSDNKTTDTSVPLPEKDSSCCEKCQLTNELMRQMLSANLYTRTGLGSSGYSAMALNGLGSSAGLGSPYNTAAGSGALAAYQSLSKYFNNSSLI